jgi:hypothetical protein
VDNVESLKYHFLHDLIQDADSSYYEKPKERGEHSITNEAVPGGLSVWKPTVDPGLDGLPTAIQEDRSLTAKPPGASRMELPEEDGEHPTARRGPLKIEGLDGSPESISHVTYLPVTPTATPNAQGRYLTTPSPAAGLRSTQTAPLTPPATPSSSSVVASTATAPRRDRSSARSQVLTPPTSSNTPSTPISHRRGRSSAGSQMLTPPTAQESSNDVASTATAPRHGRSSARNQMLTPPTSSNAPSTPISPRRGRSSAKSQMLTPPTQESSSDVTSTATAPRRNRSATRSQISTAPATPKCRSRSLDTPRTFGRNGSQERKLPGENLRVESRTVCSIVLDGDDDVFVDSAETGSYFPKYPTPPAEVTRTSASQGGKRKEKKATSSNHEISESGRTFQRGELQVSPTSTFRGGSSWLTRVLSDT